MHQADAHISAKVGEVENKLGQLKSESAASFERSKKDAEASIDKFDKTVERKTSEAKSGISSWFGFGK